MSYTGAELLTGLSQFINDYEVSTTTTAGNVAATTLQDNYLKRYQSKRLQGRYIRITSAGDNQYLMRPIASNDGSTGVVDLMYAFPEQIALGTTYEIHKYDPVQKFSALDEGAFDGSDQLYQLVYDETITCDGRANVFVVPPDMPLGPVTVYEETPCAANNLLWNFLNTPLGDSANYWTPSAGVTQTTVQTNYTDLIIPKYDYGCSVLNIDDSVAGTYSQPVADMTQSLTAADTVGRKMSLGMWVYCQVAGRLSVSIQDDSGTLSSDVHSGRGWQLLSVEKVISATNSVLLTVSLNATSGDALQCAWNRAWFYYGDKERITETYNSQSFPNVRRDATTQTFTLPRIPIRGHQLRIVGQNYVSALGTDVSDQVTNSMELTSGTARVLYAMASLILFEWQGLTAADVPEVFQRIATITRRSTRLAKLEQNMPVHSVSTPYWT